MNLGYWVDAELLKFAYSEGFSFFEFPLMRKLQYCRPLLNGGLIDRIPTRGTISTSRGRRIRYVRIVEHPQEADEFCRVCIFNDDRIVVCGSPAFMWRRVGSGGEVS